MDQRSKIYVILELAELLVKNIKELNVVPIATIRDFPPTKFDADEDCSTLHVGDSSVSDYPEYEKKLSTKDQFHPPGVYIGDKDIGDMDIAIAGKAVRVPTPTPPPPPPSLKGDETVPVEVLDSLIVGQESEKPGVFAVPDIPESALVDNYLCSGTRKAIKNAITGSSAPKAFVN